VSTIYGSDNGETIYGTEYADISIFGYGGDDAIYGYVYYNSDLIGVVQDTTSFYLSLDVNWA
jgi:hypothetical protein